jgi:hypothetical protein
LAVGQKIIRCHEFPWKPGTNTNLPDVSSYGEVILLKKTLLWSAAIIIVLGESEQAKKLFMEKLSEEDFNTLIGIAVKCGPRQNLR